MAPFKLTPRREAIIARVWRVLAAAGTVWAFVMLVLVFTGAVFALAPLWLGLLIAPGLIAALLHLVAFVADNSAVLARHADRGGVTQ